ncbi:putative disease resistance protein RGA1 [Silene latifolia]|uniref:putative disease resistance protein RGA1 n=1 Tax=Silene latifolia TaxID=37657 RepID=UPI003D77D338
MADLGTLISIADKVFQLLQTLVIKDMKDRDSDLGILNKSITSIKKMLFDLDAKQQLSREEQTWVEELKEVLYEVDDLFDKVITIAKMKQLDDERAWFLKKVLHKVSRFFSSKNRILLSYNTSQEVKSVHQKLNVIASNHDRYKSNADPQSRDYEFVNHLERRADTDSVLDENIIGRDDDMKVIVDMLLDPNVEENIGFVVIVGIGGLGKTTLARLVYSHNRIQTMFENKLWVCVSDQHGKGLPVKKILRNMIESLTKKPSYVSSVPTMQSVQARLQEELGKKTYLLILDDVWTEDPYEWKELKKYLTTARRGSRVVITTRSEKTAEVILGKATHSKKYMLKGLSDENSWRLFLLTAFDREPDEANDHELIKIGKNIVKKCSNVPLAVKVLGTLLYGQRDRWESFEKNRLPQIETTKNPIMSILKVSYDNLEPSMKHCFRCCALFPKDFEIDKRNLISLWYAQGYTDKSEDYFLVLLKRCFFQNVERNVCGDVISVKMHDLMHDLALEVVEDEIIAANSLPNILSRKNRHLFLDGREWTSNSFHERNMVKTLVVNWYWLRSLCLFVPDSEFLSESIGELLHLRYLDLSQNKKLKTLPNSIGKLYNLQCLVMRDCRGFSEWPKDFCNLVNLRLLDIRECIKLTSMPFGIDKLINLRDLTNFEVGGVSSIKEQYRGQLKDLKSLINLRGQINIAIRGNCASENEDESEDSYLKHIKNLEAIHGNLPSENESECEDSYLKHITNLKAVIIRIPARPRLTNQETLIAKLQPSEYLMQLQLNGYNGTEIPRWGRAHDDWAIILPKLVKIELIWCKKLHGIPLLSNLKHLKELSLFKLNLEYVEISGGSGSNNIPFFPSLEYLNIWSLDRLKGWRKGVGKSDSSSSKSHWLPPFPRLSTLKIYSCPKLTSFPPCPTLEFLEMRDIKDLLSISKGDGNLDIKNCSSLRSLKINECRGLTSVLGALEHLTALESLSLVDIDAELDLGHMPWSFLHQNLRSLELKYFRTLRDLPKEMMHLTALENLYIGYWYSLKRLPEWIRYLSSLQCLTLDYCPELKSLGTIQYITSLQKLTIKDCTSLSNECQKPIGKEWPKIRDIPHVFITEQ